MERRRFLQVGASLGIGAAVGGLPIGPVLAARREPAPSAVSGAPYVPVPAFPSGVVSGDPASDGVVLWTRIEPRLAGTGATVRWQVATRPDLTDGTVVAEGTATTTAAADHTVHVEVTGLLPGSIYWYRFEVDGVASPVGRTRTLPDGPVDRLRLAYFSCQRYVHGYFTAHADLARRALSPATDVDVVICLGDYVYEAGPADDVTVAGRTDPEAPTRTLADFRRQYHRYRSDPDLQAMHAAFPFVGIFDNHDGFSDPSDPAGPGARAAFFEQMPVRRAAADPDRQYRSFALGDLCELFLLDERQYRDPTPDGGDSPLGPTSVEQPLMVEPGRTMLGADQKRWLFDGLASSTAGGGPQRNAGRYVNLIGWDGYQAERRELLDHVAAGAVEDVVVLSGDAHFWTASELSTDYDDPHAPFVLAEFGGSSITSANAGEQDDLPTNDLIRPIVAVANPVHLRYLEAETHGYGLVDLTPEGASVTFVTTTITTPMAEASVLTRFELDRGRADIRQVEGGDLLPRSIPVGPAAPTGPAAPAEPGAPVPATARPAGPVAGRPALTG